MTPADKLEALEAFWRERAARLTKPYGFVTEHNLGRAYELEACADRLAAIRAEPMEAVPVYWMVSNEVFKSEAEAVEAIMQWGPSGSIAVPLYAAPPATVPVEALWELVRGLLHDAEEYRAVGHPQTGTAYARLAEKLSALITGQEKK